MIIYKRFVFEVRNGRKIVYIIRKELNVSRLVMMNSNDLTLLLLKMLNIPTRFLRFFAPSVPFIVALLMALVICELCVESVSTFERSSNGISPGGWKPDWYLKQ